MSIADLKSEPMAPFQTGAPLTATRALRGSNRAAAAAAPAPARGKCNINSPLYATLDSFLTRSFAFAESARGADPLAAAGSGVSGMTGLEESKMLKEELKLLGLPSKGSKAELRARLAAAKAGK